MTAGRPVAWYPARCGNGGGTRWLTGQRILLAQRLLEDTGEDVGQVARQAGFGNATAFRHHFRAWRGTTPQAYRRSFRAGTAGRRAPGSRALE